MATPIIKQADFLKVVESLEEQFKELRAKYEAYFNGIERIAPLKMHDDFDREMKRMYSAQIGRTAIKFRFQSLRSSYVTVSQHWTRVMRQIEDGTYRRDRFRVKLRYGDEAAGKGAGKKEEEQKKEEGAPAVPLTDDSLFDFADDPPKPKPKPDPSAGVFEKYLAAKQKTGESISGLQREKLAASLESQKQKIMEKYKARDVEFKVVIEGGKAKIKAVPKL